MNSAVTVLQSRRAVPDRHYDQAVRTALAMVGALFSLIGLLIAIGGYLSVFHGSAFYMFVGAGLMVSGALVARRHPAGAWTYMLVFAATVTWALRNVEAGSILAVRLIGPSLLLLMIGGLMPLLYRWRPRRTIAVVTLLIGATIGLGLLSLPNQPLAQHTAAVTHFFDAHTQGALK